MPVVAFVFRSGERAPPQTDEAMQHLLRKFGRRAMVVALPSDQELINLDKLPAPRFMAEGADGADEDAKQGGGGQEESGGCNNRMCKT